MANLKNFDSINLVLNIESNLISQDQTFLNINGWYKIIKNSISGIFAQNNNLYFWWNGKDILITDEFKIEIESVNHNEKSLKMFKSDELLIQFNYTIQEQNLTFSPFEYIDESDFDWGVFLQKIVNNKKAKEEFVLNNM
jgi:hypothetical protein